MRRLKFIQGLKDAQDLYRPNGGGRVPPPMNSEACTRRELDHKQRDEKEWGVCDGQTGCVQRNGGMGGAGQSVTAIRKWSSTPKKGHDITGALGRLISQSHFKSQIQKNGP